MVDNKNNQWEESEYIEDNAENQALEYDDGYNEQEAQEYADQEYADQEYEEDYEEPDDGGSAKKKSPLPLIILFLALLIAGGFIAVPKLMGSKGGENVNANQPPQQEQTVEDGQMMGFGENSQNQEDMQNQDGQQNQDDMANSFFNAAGGENNDMMSVNFNENNGDVNVMSADGSQTVATVSDNNQNINESDLFDNQGSSDDSITVAYNKVAKLNPFKPPVVTTPKEDKFETLDNMQFEIIEPPTASVPDENLTKLLQTQISGILYDKVSPSAIVNLNGQDSFVKIGDVISGYKIDNITRDKVQISYKNNSYVASVGELFTKGTLDQLSTVDNLDKKFAGRYKNK